MRKRLFRAGFFAVAVALATLAALPGLAPAGAPGSLPFGPALARAANGVDVGGSTTYTVRPEEGVVEVSSVVTIRNVRAPTATQRFYFTAYELNVHPEAERIEAIHADRQLPVVTTPEETATGVRVRVTFHRYVYYGEVYAFRLNYELPDGGPRTEGPIRVGKAFAGFYGFAYGEERADVRIVFPAGFEVITRQGATLASSAGADGSVVLAASGISAPSSWWTYVGAERPTAFRTQPFFLELDGERHLIEVKSWPEDRRWARVVRDRLDRGLPVMGELIGLPWPVDETLEVSEVYAPLLGGYAGIFYESTDEIRITEAADELIVLHEASHTWFDGDMIAGRWINEGLADEYASRTLVRLAARPYGPEEVRRDDPLAFPLNAWPDPSTASDEVADLREAYGYNASWRVVRELVEEVGEDRMREVFRAAQGRTIPYVGVGRAEPMPEGQPVDWRVFLDLLEERGGSTAAGRLFDRWVVTSPERALLDDRREARGAYRELRSRGWAAPLPLRLELAAWDFDEAAGMIEEAQELLDLRDRVERLSNAVGTEPTRRLERAFEGAGDLEQLAEARLLAEEQLRTLAEVSRAAELLARDRDPLTSLGLLSEAPGAALAEARGRFSRDDLGGARASAQRAVTLLNDAPARGRERALIVTMALALAVAVLVTLGIRLGRRRRDPVATMGPALPREGDPPSS